MPKIPSRWEQYLVAHGGATRTAAA
jgi:hypothetical protein